MLASYAYLGQGTAVRIDYEQPEVRLDLWGPGETSGTYAGFDRFGRVIDQRWRDYAPGSAADLVRHEHGYDRASNRLYRKDVVAGSGHDELYSYDGLHRLTGAQRGTLNAQRDDVSTLNFAQAWALNQLGNWDGFQQDDNGDATWNLEQTRAHNVANEITAIGATTGTVWADPGHDRAGNMTTIPQPAALADSFTAVYDAWNRLVRVTNDADNDKTVAEYEYDARNFRIVKKVYDDGALDQTRYAFFSESWQILEERVDGTASTDVAVQYVWGGPGRYVDELICRDRDTTANGVPNERTYALQDANFNVVALIADDGAVLERYRFTPYGQRTVLNANFTVHADPTAGGYAFVIGHQGLTHDTETGFIDNRHRFIVPPLGRFGQRDPLNQNVARGGYQDGMGLYEYVGSSPAIHLDPMGLDFIAIATRSVLLGIPAHHYSLEYWKSDCPGPRQRYMRELGYRAMYPDAEMLEAVELLNERGYNVWMKHTGTQQVTYSGQPNYYIDSAVSGDLRDGVSVVYHWSTGVYGGTSAGTDDDRWFIRILDSTVPSVSKDDVRDTWRRLIVNARSYEWAEQDDGEDPPGNVSNWPRSKYRALGTNSNVFVRQMTFRSGLPMREYSLALHPPSPAWEPQQNPVPSASPGLSWISDPWHPEYGGVPQPGLSPWSPY